MSSELGLVACCAACGCSAFGIGYLACAPRGPAQGRGWVVRDPLGEALRRVRELPLLRQVEERGVRARGRAECLRQMPVMLDVVTLGLSAGLSFDAALELYCQRYANLLAHELGAAMLTWRLGTASREEALGQMARRVGVASLDRFAGVVAQALSFGSPLAATLEQQAQAIREEQRAQIEEEIEQVPVRMLIPLGTLIVPALLISILGPLLGASLQVG